MRSDIEHRCLDAADVVRLSPEVAYGRASDCPLCKELIDFFVREGRLREARNSTARVPSPRLDRRSVDELLDAFNLSQQHRVMYKFTDVISETLPRLEPGDRVELVSMGELLEAHHPFAFAEVARAIDRGVKFEYRIAVEARSQQDDATLLQQGLARSLGPNVVRSRVNVRYDAISLHDRKDVVYVGPHDQPKSRLIELAYREEDPPGNLSRLWIRLPEEKRSEFIEALQGVTERR